MSVLRFLFGDDSPGMVVMQVVWKLLTWGLSATLLYAWQTSPGPFDGFQTVVVLTLASLFFVMGLFTKLGDG